MTKTLSAAKAMEQVQRRAEEIRNDQPQRFPEAASVGEFCRQGDIYLTLLADVPAGAKEIPVRHQIAEGNTQGARHCLDARAGVRMFVLPNADVLTGPVLLLTEERTITHPEHGHWVLPAGVYGVTYQRQFADELRRVAD